MKRLKNFLFLLAAAPVLAFATTTVHLDKAPVNLSDQDSLQRGARMFVNYCLNCHSAGSMRYSRLQDLGLTEDQIKDNLMFAAEKPGETMKVGMTKSDGKTWFGATPPDLSVIARSRGADWLYTYLRSFYRDPESHSGWNNVVFPHVAMPHVLYEWQGDQRAVFKKDAHGVDVFEGFELERPGSMSAKDYDAAMRDLTNFLVYLGEPAKLVRYQIGLYVLIFLAVFLVFAYLLKKEYWKDVH